MRFDSFQDQLSALLGSERERGPFARLWGVTQEPAQVSATALTALLQQLAPQHAKRGPALRPFFAAACAELAQNLEVIRELAETRQHPPFSYVTWLWKVSEVLASLERDGWLEAPSPLAKLEPQPVRRLRLPASPLLPPLRTGPRLQGLAIQPLLDIASRETSQLGRRRRLLEAARRLLLETAAGVAMPPAEVQARVVSLTQQIRQINQWQAGGLDPDVDVGHQLRVAVRRRDPAAVTALLTAFEELARGTSTTPRLQARLGQARELVHARFERLAGPPSLEQLCRDTFGDTAARAVQQGSARALNEANAMPHAHGELIRVGSAVDGAFELGRSVAPVRALEEQRRMALVEYPTASMVLAPARRVSDLTNSLIGDPRTLVYDLASHSLLARRYLAERKQRRRLSTPRYSEARYYLLDGSASMAGRRGRMRDAILIAELSSMIRHLEHGTATARPVVYYRYFSKGSEPLVKASSVEEAAAAIEEILVRRSRGETDIEGALLESFAELGRERTGDDSLRRAQFVLVTDGAAQVDLQKVWQARSQALDIPVQVSVIALGSENPALKELAAVQRARGEAVFYHYLSDEALHTLSRSVAVQPPRPSKRLAAFPAPHAAVAPRAAPAVDAEDEPEPTNAEPSGDDGELWSELDELVDELAVLAQPPDLDGIERAQFLNAAYDELGVSLSDGAFEAERAHCDAQRRDARALSLRFDRWFPPSPIGPAGVQSPRAKRGAPAAELLQVIEIALLSVLDLIAYLDGPPLQRRVDAIEILERLLVEAGVSPWDYCHALPHATPASQQAIAALRVLVSARDQH